MQLDGKLTKDRRIEKTRRLLHDALISLTREKPYQQGPNGIRSFAEIADNLRCDT